MGRDHARRIHQGGLPLGGRDVIHLATALQLEPSEIIRPLTDDEMNAWAFYRLSARDVTAVWRRVAEASTAHGLSQRKLAVMLGVPQSALSRAVRGERKSPVLNWHDAAMIAGALGLEGGAEVFLSPDFTRENDLGRG